MERIAIFPGSFDPFTRGHEAIVEEALSLFDKVIIGIGHNVAKRGLMGVESRRALIEELYREQPRVECRIYTELTTDFARRVGAVAMIRGVRNALDFEYERTIASANRRIAPEIATVILMTPNEVADITSSTIRELLAFGHDVDRMMPEGIKIENYLNRE